MTEIQVAIDNSTQGSTGDEAARGVKTRDRRERRVPSRLVVEHIQQVSVLLPAAAVAAVARPGQQLQLRSIGLKRCHFLRLNTKHLISITY